MSLPDMNTYIYIYIVQENVIFENDDVIRIISRKISFPVNFVSSEGRLVRVRARVGAFTP